MKRLVLASLTLLCASVALAEEAAAPPVSEKVAKLINEALPTCTEAVKMSRVAVPKKMPLGITGSIVRVESDRGSCAGNWINANTPEGSFFLGVPWFLENEKGTIEEKLKNFAWNNMQQNFTAVVDRSAKTKDGLYRVTLLQQTERGKMPLEGEVDPEGTVFFMGHFVPAGVDVLTQRLKNFEPFTANAPATGAAKPEVTVIEFSDFECPSCQRAAGYMKPILAKYGDKVRYIRYDLPLVSMHPWAFSAAIAGRAIYRQKPDLFWQYKEQVYENQDKLSTFTIDDFARNFAKDHELNLERFDADVNNAALRDELLKGAGTALVNDIRSTPSYLVNGATVDAGDGSGLEKYIAGLLAKK